MALKCKFSVDFHFKQYATHKYLLCFRWELVYEKYLLPKLFKYD